MIEPTEEAIEKARDLVSNGIPQAVGYRIMMKPLEFTTELTMSEKKKFETLGKIGFQDKTKNEADKHSKGTYFGLVLHVGDFAYKTEQLGKDKWVQEGDVAVFDRYAGVELEIPPGSGNKYRFVNDESILGKMR